MKFSPPRHFRHRFSGFTLIELMVAMFLSLLIIGVIGVGYVNMSGVQRLSTNYGEYRTNGRYAVDLLRRELQHAGFVNFAANGFVATGAALTTDYGCGVGFATALEQPVGGANDSNPYSISCLDGSAGRQRVRGDILVIRRLSQRPVTAFATDRLYFRATYEQGFVFAGSTAPTVVRVPTEDYAVQTDVYFISPYTLSTNESPQVPALYRLTLGAGPALAPQLIASNVENLQVQYGIATATGSVRYLNANQVATSVDWGNTVAVRVWLLTRATAADAGFTNTSTYVMGDQTVTASDGFQRELHSFAVQLRR